MENAPSPIIPKRQARIDEGSNLRYGIVLQVIDPFQTRFGRNGLYLKIHLLIGVLDRRIAFVSLGWDRLGLYLYVDLNLGEFELEMQRFYLECRYIVYLAQPYFSVTN
jgi:hypothetical protein